MAHKQTLIGLTGYAGSGKDTVREMLERDHGFTGLAFADGIRTMLRALFSEAGISADWMDTRSLKEQPIDGLGVSYRHMAQTLGTEWGRVHMGRRFWLQIAQQRINELHRQGSRLIVVSDVRFDNESQWIKEQGGQLWRISRSATEAVRPHVSEHNIDTLKHDRWINNCGTVEDLWCDVAELLNDEATA
jgi:hypothetical protein